MNKINILVADDHEVMRDGITSTLIEEEIVNTIYEASNGKETLATCQAHDDIDIVLLDISMPDMDGIEAASRIKEEHPNIEVIAFSMLDDIEFIRKMLKAGASGYVLKNAGRSDLVQAIRNVSKGNPFYSNDVTMRIMKGISSSESPKIENSPISLTDREIEILQLIAQEYTNQEIADKLYISKRTVDTHRTNLLQKTNSKNTAGLVRYAIRNNLI